MKTIYVKLYPPFSGSIGVSKVEMEIENEYIHFKTLLYYLKNKDPIIADIMPYEISKENLYGFCFPVRKGELLGFDDIIYTGDLIEIYGSLQGG